MSKLESDSGLVLFFDMSFSRRPTNEWRGSVDGFFREPIYIDHRDLVGPKMYRFFFVCVYERIESKALRTRMCRHNATLYSGARGITPG